MQKLNDQIGATPSAIVQSVCVYCGSGKGLTPSYAVAARTLGQTLAAQNIRLIYGGGSLGLMGEVARSALEAGGKVTGIIPEFLGSKEKMLKDVDELIVVDDMHIRKRMMFERSDAFVALRTPISASSSRRRRMTSLLKPIRKRTSSGERRQFSVLKA